jgi:hypothetical protein
MLHFCNLVAFWEERDEGRGKSRKRERKRMIKRKVEMVIGNRQTVIGLLTLFINRNSYVLNFKSSFPFLTQLPWYGIGQVRFLL